MMPLQHFAHLLAKQWISPSELLIRQSLGIEEQLQFYLRCAYEPQL
jgi:hypothetical protein